MIPKTIHYCWFGRNPKPKLAEKCIESWKKFCPDYKIIEWNEDNFDIHSAPLYVRQAYEAKKWAFVTDYVRLWAMTTYGGIYMDTDVEVIKPIDCFLKHEAFSGFESETQIPTGIMACRKGFPLFTELMKYYDTALFINEDGSLNLTTNVTIITEICSKKGFRPNGEFQIVDGFMLYPTEFFCPMSWDTRKMEKTENSCAIHWFSASWWDAEQKKNHKKSMLKRKIKTIIGEKTYNRLKKLILGDRICRN